MFAILQLWWPVLVLLHLPLLVNTIAVTLFKRIAHTHDSRVFDLLRLSYLPLIVAIGGGLIT